MRICDLHTDLIGKICKVTEFGVELQKEYADLFGIGSVFITNRLFEYCQLEGKNKVSLIFIDEKPIIKNGVVFYALKEIGKYTNGDYYWFSLNQLMICEE